MTVRDVALRNAKPKAKPYKIAADTGLFLLVNPNGTKWWRMRYRHGGREKMLSLGVYPAVPLRDARERLADARALLARGVDPSSQRKAERGALADSFEAVAREYHATRKATWTEAHAHRFLRGLERNAFPWIGRHPVASITAPDLLAVLRRIEGRGHTETAHRTASECGQVFRYAIATGRRTDPDPAPSLRGALAPVRAKHHASITEPAKVGQLLRALDGYSGHHATCCALRLAPLLFVRPGELRAAEWAEFNLDASEWRIPAARMKMRETHIVPLSSQALAILRDLQPLTGAGRYLFPSMRTRARPMSENTINAALRRLGFGKDEMTGHGFRSMASTLLNEQGWNRDAIERQLAHAERDEIRAAYNYAEFLPERRRMMQAWADYLDGLRNGALVTPILRAVKA